MSQKHFAFMILGFLWIFMEEKLASTVAIGLCAYYNPVKRLLGEKT